MYSWLLATLCPLYMPDIPTPSHPLVSAPDAWDQGVWWVWKACLHVVSGLRALRSSLPHLVPLAPAPPPCTPFFNP